MGLFGPSLGEQLNTIVRETNGYVQSAQCIVRNAGSISNLSMYDKNRLRTLGQQILFGMNSASSIIEKKRSLMLSMVPGFEGPVTGIAWMSWIMQWFDSFDKDMRQYL